MTEYGRPSGPVTIGFYNGVLVAFIPRHGYEHSIPPHKVPYKANLAALKMLGVRHVIATCVVGSLRKNIKPGTFVVPNQFMNFTWGRDDVFDIEHKLAHLPMAQPYCNILNNLLIQQTRSNLLKCKANATVVVIQGPRFSTKAESKMFSLLGGDIINMTQYPECYFARDLGMCYGVIATVTDYDVGVPSKISVSGDSMSRVLSVFNDNTKATYKLLKKILMKSEEIVKCNCAQKEFVEYYKHSI